MIEANWAAAFAIAASIASILAVRIMLLRRDLKAAAESAIDERKALAEAHRNELRQKDNEIRRLRTAYRNLRLTRAEDIDCAKLEGYQRAKAEYDAELEARLRSKKRSAIHSTVETARKEA